MPSKEWLRLLARGTRIPAFLNLTRLERANMWGVLGLRRRRRATGRTMVNCLRRNKNQ